MFTLKRVLHHLGLVAALLSIVFAVVVSILNLLTPLLNKYHSFFEVLATEFLHRPVGFGEVTISWHHLQPVILLNDVEIHKNDTQRIP